MTDPLPDPLDAALALIAALRARISLLEDHNISLLGVLQGMQARYPDDENVAQANSDAVQTLANIAAHAAASNLAPADLPDGPGCDQAPAAADPLPAVVVTITSEVPVTSFTGTDAQTVTVTPIDPTGLDVHGTAAPVSSSADVVDPAAAPAGGALTEVTDMDRTPVETELPEAPPAPDTNLAAPAVDADPSVPAPAAPGAAPAAQDGSADAAAPLAAAAAP